MSEAEPTTPGAVSLKAGGPVTHFVVLGHPRSGSTLLVQSLRQHPGIRVYGELFQDEAETRRTSFRGSMEFYEEGTDGAAFLESRILGETGDPAVLAIGFKLFYEQARRPAASTAWRYLLERRDLRVIHLTRDRLVDAYVSLREAEASGRWLLEAGAARPDPTTIRIDPGRCLAFLNETYVYRGWVRRAFRHHPLLELSYERDLLADFNGGLRKAQTFLDVPALDLSPPLRRQGVRPLSDRVSNYGEMLAALRNTVHA